MISFRLKKPQIDFFKIVSGASAFNVQGTSSNIYNKKTKGSTLMELFTATRKQKKFFFDN